MHTHFGSITHGASVFLSVLVFGSFWRLGWMHGLNSKSAHIRGLARAALYQF